VADTYATVVLPPGGKLRAYELVVDIAGEW